jgi:hypothetical protein
MIGSLPSVAPMSRAAAFCSARFLSGAVFQLFSVQ